MQVAAGGLTEGSGDTVGILKVDEFYCHTFVVMAHDAAPDPREDDHRLLGRLDGAGDRGTTQRDVEHAAVMHVSARQNDLRGADARNDALVLPPVVKVEPFLVDEPGEEIDDALTLDIGRQDARGKSALDGLTTTPSMRPRLSR
jgi:hypothetical protein